jgi:hypothetical protein
MKYRYDVEVDHAHRSALRRIFEHDDSPGKTMVLCVSRIHSVESRLEGQDPSTSVELSDGWYSIRGVLDSVLEEMVQRGTIEVGCKLCVTGAELSGLDSPSPPLEVHMIDICYHLYRHGNSFVHRLRRVLPCVSMATQHVELSGMPNLATRGIPDLCMFLSALFSQQVGR